MIDYHKIPPTGSGQFTHVFMVMGAYGQNKPHPQFDEMCEWCIENFGEPDGAGRWVVDTCAWIKRVRDFYFVRDDDALLFKMRWM